MDRGAWQATVHGVKKVRHNLATKQQLPPNSPTSVENSFLHRRIVPAIILPDSRGFSRVGRSISENSARSQI